MPLKPPYCHTTIQVAEALIAGRKVEPETKECVSIFVSDIVGYTALSQDMLPAAVSDLLDRFVVNAKQYTSPCNIARILHTGLWHVIALRRSELHVYV